MDNMGLSQCGIGVTGNYDTLVHFYALIFILILSTLACGLPLLSKIAFKKCRTGNLLFLSLHFGTGVLIATAFVHLLPMAFMSLTNPCLASFFNMKYTPLAGLISMISTLIIVGLEMYLTTRGARGSHSHEGPVSKSPLGNSYTKNFDTSRRALNENSLGLPLHQRRNSLQDTDASEALLETASAFSISTPVFAQPTSGSFHPCEYENMYPYESMDSSVNLSSPKAIQMDEVSIDSLPISPEDHQKRQILQCIMLEAGILFHSIFIGIALSVATGPSFFVILAAIGFHQSFEGLALGSRIAAIGFSTRSIRPWFMVLAYGITTPIGQGIGIIMHNIYDPQSVAGLLIVGIMNGISSGLLLYAGLVQLLAKDFLSHQSYHLLKGKQRVKAFCSVVAGASSMALIGAWA
ncbi:putative zinc-regulated transporter 1 protein [Erysiphe necator]|uniref:Putative zinc-regulated transporter 1 protein n=1 Tax=Uncinula necator TaxID=52586 RepID=A0A0B1P7E2_UNCNE|nr:putative zinc-regulated transporter 1 protein [Erysiphe necator]